jgi:hypothetical protein
MKNISKIRNNENMQIAANVAARLVATYQREERRVQWKSIGRAEPSRFFREKNRR